MALLVRLSSFTKAGVLQVGLQVHEYKGTFVRMQLCPFPRGRAALVPAHAGRDKDVPTDSAAVDNDPSSHTYWSLRHRYHLS